MTTVAKVNEEVLTLLKGTINQFLSLPPTRIVLISIELGFPI